jgi:uncharacterized protein (TIGR00661 family)
MKKIFYSLAGEGLGHSSRVLSIIESMKDVEFYIFTWGEAFNFFQKQNLKNLHHITPIPFGRNKNNKISYLKTLFNFYKFHNESKIDSLYIKDLYYQIKPDIFISDFEPLLPRIANDLKVKLISIDNQHRFSRCYSSDMPLNLKIYCKLAGYFVEKWVPNPHSVIISTFNHEIFKESNNVYLTNTFLRNKIEQTKPTVNDFILVYYKGSMGTKILDILSELNLNIKIFGCPHKHYNFDYYDIDQDNFIKFLASCKAVIGGAGNQLLGEANYYGKPIFCIPEPNQQEQSVNGYFIEQMKRGICATHQKLTKELVVDFLNKYKCINQISDNGTYKAVEIIRKFLNEK